MTPVRNQIGDRLIPTRAGNNWQTAFHIRDEPSSSSSGPRNRPETAGPSVVPGDAAGRDRSLFRAILENEVLNSGIEDPRELTNKKRRVFNVINLPFYLIACVSVCSLSISYLAVWEPIEIRKSCQSTLLIITFESCQSETAAIPAKSSEKDCQSAFQSK